MGGLFLHKKRRPQTADGRPQKNTAYVLVRRGRLGKAARCDIRPRPIRF